MMTNITNKGELLQGSTHHEILKAYQATSKFDADTPFEEYLEVIWQRLEEWDPRGKKKPEGDMLVAEIWAWLILTGFLTEVK